MSGGIILAAPQSGSGKTTLVLALLRYLKRQGRRVASAKTGPDYIDPAFHAAASGGACLNLDPWAMRAEALDALACELEAAGEFVICEGAMGLFDGIGGGEAGSTADLAARLRWPVVLAVDAARQSASVAALLEGFARHRADVAIRGVIFNRVGSARHAASLAEAARAALPDLAILGWVPRRAELELPERHLGLVQAQEHGALESFLDRAAEIVGETVDLDAFLRLARPARAVPQGSRVPLLPPLGQRIAVARDQAFSFAYPAVLEGWRAAGAEIGFFSPLGDEAPAADAAAVYLPGGYPELHAGRLAANARFLNGLRSHAQRGTAIYGECGGYMVLGQGLIDAAGARHAMAGLLPVTTSFAERRLHLGYREARLLAAAPLGPAGAGFRGHEFHYARALDEPRNAALFELSDGSGAAIGKRGARQGSVMGSFIHLIDRAAS